MKFNGWFGFWVFLCSILVADCFMLSKGIDGYFYKFITVEEKLLQQKLIEEVKTKPTD